MNEFDNDKRREQLDAIGRQMRDGIAGKVRRRRTRNRIAGGACAVAAFSVAAVGALAQLPGGGSDPVEPASAAAVLERAAGAAESFRPRELQPGEYFYTNESETTRVGVKSEGKAYYWNRGIERESWAAEDKSGLLRSNGYDFSSKRDKQIAEDAGFPSPGPNEYFSIKEQIAPPGWFSDESRAAATYTLPEEDVTDDLLEGYDLEDNELATLSRNQKRFNSYVRGRVSRVTRKLSKKRASRASLARSADDATFSLTVELLSQPRLVHAGKLRAALLRLAVTADDELDVDPNAHDLLGRPGVAVTETFTTEEEDGSEEESTSVILFDPETFVVLETRERPKSDPIPASSLPATPYAFDWATDYEYGVVKQLRQRPDGSTVAPAKTIEKLR